MPVEFRIGRERHADEVRDLLNEHGQVVAPGLIDSDEAGATAGQSLAARQVDVVVVAPTMAAPPSYTWAALEQVGRVPVVVLGVQESKRVPIDYDTEEATRRSLPVGVVMLTNVLVRHRVPFVTVIGSWDDPDLVDHVEAALLGAFAASSVRGARLLAVGSPIDGYSDVEVGESDLERLQISVASVSAERLAAAFESVEESTVETALALERSSAEVSEVPDQVLRRSVRLTCALRDICDEEDVAGGALNCHGDHFRWNPRVGITACLGLSRLSEEGRPFACTGDVPTSIALILGKQLAGSALYCELYQLDMERDWVLIANGGEGDVSMRDKGRPVRLLPEDHYMGDSGPGTAVAFSLPEGPATLISLTPLESASGGWRLIAARGSVVGSEHDQMEGPNGMFRFEVGDVSAAYRQWCDAGATHHAALLPGHHSGSLTSAARFLEVELSEI